MMELVGEELFSSQNLFSTNTLTQTVQEIIAFSMRSLTQQNNDTEENGNEGAGAEASGEEQGFCAAGLHVALAVAGAHADGQRARAALNRVIVVRDHHRQEIRTYFVSIESIFSG